MDVAAECFNKAFKRAVYLSSEISGTRRYNELEQALKFAGEQL